MRNQGGNISEVEYVIGVGSQVAIGIGVSSEIIITTVLGQSLGAMWSMVNTLQLVNYFTI